MTRICVLPKFSVKKGTDRSAFMRGEVDKYTWVEVGSSYVLSELLAAVAVEQWHKLPEITRRKTEQAERLIAALAPYRPSSSCRLREPGCHPTGTSLRCSSIHCDAIG